MSAHVPASTYRLQVSPTFDLDDAVGVADYLDRLGVSDLYSSPLLAAEPGSTHGYDVVDPTRVDPDRGGEEAFARGSASSAWGSWSTSCPTTWPC